MAKILNQATEKAETVPVLEVSEFVETKESKTPLPTIKRGEVLVAEIDDNGKEHNFFVSNQKTFDEFYSKNPKFKLKKN